MCFIWINNFGFIPVESFGSATKILQLSPSLVPPGPKVTHEPAASQSPLSVNAVTIMDHTLLYNTVIIW